MESKLIAKEKEVVIPAEVLAEGLDYLPGRNAYRDGNFIRAKACLRNNAILKNIEIEDSPDKYDITNKNGLRD